MDRAYNNNNKDNDPMSILVNCSKQTKNIKQNELNQKNYSKTSSNKKSILSNQENQKLNTDVLDDAMQELLDICQQYNDKLTMNEKPNERIDNSSHHSRNNPSKGNKDNNSTLTNHSDSKHSGMHSSSKESKMQRPEMTASSDNMWLPSGSIERLQQRQSMLQSQLDEVLKAAKSLANKQKRKLKCILEDDNDDDVSSKGDDAEDEENELLEFQQIENELRISDLNRQLDAIQEELRIRLFKRLVSNTNNRHKPQQHDQTVQQQQQQHTGESNAHVNNSSPSSSSCSDELTATSNSDASHSATNKATRKSKDLHEKQMISDQRPEDSTDEPDAHAGELECHHENAKEPGNRSHREIAGTVNANNDFLSNFNIDQPTSGATSKNSSTSSTTPTNNQSDLDSALDNMRGNEMLTPTTSKESLGYSEKRSSPINSNNIYSNINASYHSPHHQSNAQTFYPFSYYQINSNGQIYPSNGTLRNNSANSDLERIEEDEEDCQDYYGNSNHFRTIYEEKLSPILHGTGGSGSKQQHDDMNTYDLLGKQHQAPKPTESKDFYGRSCQKVAPSGICYNNSQLQQQQHVNQRYDPSSEASFDRSTESSNYNNNSFNASGSTVSSVSNSKKNTTSRPLTLYLPKPDEEIDLIEHIQALGHDLNIISNDLKLNSTSAHGYLWKSCSNNNKKWLKRYFYFDRKLKVLSYYENENQLVKKHSKPKNSIRFEEISDVYVDHKLSGIGERDRSSKRKNYVFVLATIGRKYLLASSRVETMRAWIDMLFTAAKANDYFQQLGTIDGVDDVVEDGNLFLQAADENQ